MTEIYSISTSFPNDLDEYQLKIQILANIGITIPCINVSRNGDELNIIFATQISSTEKTILNNMITNYVFVPTPIIAPLYISDNIIKSDISNSTFTFLGNQPDEIHISKTNQTHYPSIKAALVARNEPNIVFIVYPGTYVEDNPLILPSGTCLLAQGNAENTFIVAQNANEDVLHIGIRCKIEGFTLVGSSVLGSRGIYFDGTQSGGLGRFSAIFETYIVGCNIGIEIDGKDVGMGVDTLYLREILIVSTTYTIDRGIYCHSRGQAITMGVNIAGNPNFIINRGIFCTDAGSKVSMTTSSVWFSDTGLYIDNNGEIELQLLTSKYCNTALYVGTSGTTSAINGGLLNAISSTNYDIDIQASDASIHLQSGIIDILKILNPNNVKINAQFQSTQFGAYFHNILGDVIFGTKRVPAKLAIGEGTYDIDNIKLFTNDNLEVGNWVDVSQGAVTIGAPAFNIFSSTTIGNCFYIGRSENPVGIKINITQATSSIVEVTDVIWEYWNGAEWIEFKISQTTTVPPYYNDGKNFLSYVGKYQLRFGITSATPIVTKTLNGENKKWIRARLLNNISNIPIAEYCKLHVNSKEINSDGFTEYYGNSRPIEALNKWNNFLYTSDNLYISNNFAVATKVFPPLVKTTIGINGYIPSNADIGFPIKMKIAIAGDSDTPGNVKLNLHYSSTNLTSFIYSNSQDAPISSSNEQVISVIINIAISKQEYREVFLIDISKFIINPSNGQADLIWLNIERDGTSDTYPGAIRIVNVESKYVKIYEGSHLLSY